MKEIVARVDNLKSRYEKKQKELALAFKEAVAQLDLDRGGLSDKQYSSRRSRREDRLNDGIDALDKATLLEIKAIDKAFIKLTTSIYKSEKFTLINTI